MLIKVRPCLCQTCPSKRFRKLFFTLPSCEISHLASRPQPIADGFGRCSRTLEAAFQRHSLALATLFSIFLGRDKWTIAFRCYRAKGFRSQMIPHRFSVIHPQAWTALRHYKRLDLNPFSRIAAIRNYCLLSKGLHSSASASSSSRFRVVKFHTSLQGHNP